MWAKFKKMGALRPLLPPPHGRTADHKSRGVQKKLVVGWWCAGLGFVCFFGDLLHSTMVNHHEIRHHLGEDFWNFCQPPNIRKFKWLVGVFLLLAFLLQVTKVFSR